MNDVARVVDDAAERTEFAGVARLDRGGACVFEAAYGLADRRHGIAMTTGHQMGMASGSKTFTALVVLRLVEQGLLALATTAREVLRDDLPLIADDVTVEQLLCHRSGIGDYLDEDEVDGEDYELAVSAHRLATTSDFLPILGGHPTKFRAGERFSYCNGGYVVLALIAERVTGRSYQELVRELVCSPAGMTETEFLRSDALPGRAALGYLEVDGQWRTNVFNLPVVASGDGGAYTTAADMSRFWSALVGGLIVSADSLADMLTARSQPDQGESRTYGLGIWLDAESPWLTMSGGDAGVSFWSTHDPAHDLTATVISSRMDGAWPVAKALSSLL